MTEPIRTNAPGGPAQTPFIAPTARPPMLVIGDTKKPDSKSDPVNPVNPVKPDVKDSKDEKKGTILIEAASAKKPAAQIFDIYELVHQYVGNRKGLITKYLYDDNFRNELALGEVEVLWSHLTEHLMRFVKSNGTFKGIKFDDNFGTGILEHKLIAKFFRGDVHFEFVGLNPEDLKKIAQWNSLLKDSQFNGVTSLHSRHEHLYGESTRESLLHELNSIRGAAAAQASDGIDYIDESEFM